MSLINDYIILHHADPGLNFLIPFVDSISYVQNLKEIAIDIPQQSAVSSDNVTLHIDGVLYLKVNDPYKGLFGSSSNRLDCINYFNFSFLWSRGS